MCVLCVQLSCTCFHSTNYLSNQFFIKIISELKLNSQMKLARHNPRGPNQVLVEQASKTFKIPMISLDHEHRLFVYSSSSPGSDWRGTVTSPMLRCIWAALPWKAACLSLSDTFHFSMTFPQVSVRKKAVAWLPWQLTGLLETA